MVEIHGYKALISVGGADQRTVTATTRLATNWMRAGVPAKNVASKIDEHFNSGDQERISRGPTDSTQTHSMSEIRDAVIKTRDVLKPKPMPKPMLRSKL